MTEISFTFAEALFALVWILCRAAVWIRNRRIDWRREAALLLIYVNFAVILRFAFFPMARSGGRVQPLVFDPASALPFRINLVPFVHLTEYDSRRDLLLNTIGNAAMFIPGGIVLPVVYKKLDGFLKVVLAGALISLCIELLQLPFSARATDIDDLLLNTAGTAVGYGIYALARRVKNARAQRPLF